MAYSVADYGAMLLDAQRRTAYLAALDRCITPDSQVLDLGAGTGFFTLAALQRGAQHVTAVDVNDAIRLLPEILADNGLAGRATVYQADIRDLDLGRFDVVITDLRGTLPLFSDHLDVLADVRDRLVGPDGVLLPLRDDLYVALTGASEWWSRTSAPWDLDGLDHRAERNHVRQGWLSFGAKERVEPLGSGGCWATIDYTSAGMLRVRRYQSTLDLISSSQGEVHGLLLWFEATLLPGIGFSTGTHNPSPVYGRGFLPFAEPLPLAVGQRVTVELRAQRHGPDYVWQWSADADGARREGNSLNSFLVDPGLLQSTRLDAPAAERDVALLSGLAQGAERDALVRLALPSFADAATATAHVSRLIRRYRSAGPRQLL